MTDYLKGTIQNLKLLTLVVEKDIMKESLAQIQDKEKAMKLLEQMAPLPACNLPNISSWAMKDQKVPEIINLLDKKDFLTKRNCSLLDSYIDSFGLDLMDPVQFSKYFMKFCDISHFTDQNITNDLRLYIFLSETGHTHLRDLLYANSSARREIMKHIQVKKALEKDLEVYYILEEFPREQNPLNRPNNEVVDFVYALHEPGALDICKLSKNGLCDISIKKGNDYSKSVPMFKEIMEIIEFSCRTEGDRYLYANFAVFASEINFDPKMLSVYLRNIKAADREQIISSLSSMNCFLAVCTGNRYGELMSKINNGCHQLQNLTQKALIMNKKAFLRLLESDLDEFLQLPDNSILYNRQFQEMCNINTLSTKNIRTLLKKDKDGYLYTSGRCKLNHLQSGHPYTFEELISLGMKSTSLQNIYAKIDPSLGVDERLCRIRQLFHESLDVSDISIMDTKYAASALSKERLSDFCTRHGYIKGVSKGTMFRLMLAQEKDDRVKTLLENAKNDSPSRLLHPIDVDTILHNMDNPQLFSLGLFGFKDSFIELDTDSIWLREQIDIPDEFMGNYREFCLAGNASIVHDYYNSIEYDNDDQRKNILLITKAEIYGKLDEVKYQDLTSEIAFPISAEQETAWKHNALIQDGSLTAEEHMDFQSSMNIGIYPKRTCMSYKNGAYNECLLSIFDGNKKVLYVREHEQIIGRAIIRLTKVSDSKDVKTVRFMDVGEKQDMDSSEELAIFLERCYTNGLSDKKKDVVMNLMVKAARKKAAELNALFVISSDYNGTALLSVKTVL